MGKEVKPFKLQFSEDTLQTLESPFYSTCWGIALIILGVFMWHELLPIFIGSAFLVLGLIAFLFGNEKDNK